MSEQPAIGGRTPVAVEVEAGKDYWWCVCGKSANQPFCDGSHQGSTFSPLQYTAAETKRAFFCTCKQTANSPLCDGSHNNLPASA
jgi:CDGSH iron-sulfur domain-containing protein 3